MKFNQDYAEYDQWIRIDCMVRSWILNSISKEIVETFICTNIARDLWPVLGERFEEYNGHLMYQLQREINSNPIGKKE